MTGLAPQGYYAATAAKVGFPSLSRQRRHDVCVIGGGFTGLSAALHLAQAGAKVALLEAEEIGFAASGRNGGQIHSGQRKDQSELETWLGDAHARDLWALAEDAKQLVRSIVAEYNIDCDLKSGLIIAAHNRAALAGLAADTEHLHARYSYMQAWTLDAQAVARATGTDIYPGGRFDEGGGHLHPLKFARGLAEAAARAGVTIFEHSRALSLEQSADRSVVRTAKGTITADQTIVALDAFSADLLPSLEPYIAHVESFIVATTPLNPALDEAILPSDAAVADTRHVLDYYRKSADRRLLFAGRESYWSVPTNVAEIVRPRMLRVFPCLKETALEFAWSGTVGITATRMPHFGAVGKRVSFAHGYSGHGVALATLGGQVLAERVLGKSERFDILARVPARPFPGGRLLRKPLVSAALYWFKLVDSL